MHPTCPPADAGDRESGLAYEKPFGRPVMCITGLGLFGSASLSSRQRLGRASERNIGLTH